MGCFWTSPSSPSWSSATAHRGPGADAGLARYLTSSWQADYGRAQMWLQAASSAASAASTAKEGPSIFFLDRGFWAWNGWPGVAAIGQLVAAAAVLATLWFFWQQLKGVREQARKDFELAHTPLISIELTEGAASGNRTDTFIISFRVNAAGEGPAYNVGVSMYREDDPQHLYANPPSFRTSWRPSRKRKARSNGRTQSSWPGLTMLVLD